MKGMDAGLTGTLAVPMLPKVAIIQRATVVSTHFFLPTHRSTFPLLTLRANAETS